jgi:hypothetical protein
MAKPARWGERVEVEYDKERWRLLAGLREEATKIMEALWRFQIDAFTYGSIARGDVSEKSDIDIFTPTPPASFRIELALQDARIPILKRSVVQATPRYALKGVVETGERRSVSFPLVKLREVEKGFYEFAGEATLSTLRQNLRVRGVDKRLMLIEPTPKGHVESSILGREEEAASLLGVPLETVRERVRVLMRRDEIGRTGIFIDREVGPDETFELAVKKLVEQNPAVRRRFSLERI